MCESTCSMVLFCTTYVWCEEAIAREYVHYSERSKNKKSELKTMEEGKTDEK